jgi:hypothetical integral membrane protein (TIGR02206 family)
MYPTFETFSSLWWQTSGTTVAFTVLMLVALRFLTQEARAAYARSLGWLLLLWIVMPPVLHSVTGDWNRGSGLPLQWCDLAGGIAGLALLTRGQFLYETSLFWGITGATTAMLTPNFTQGTTWYFLAEFFISHSILMTAPIFLSIYGSMRPRAWSWLGSLGWLNIAALVIGAFDYLADANYMFLFTAPNARNVPLFQIKWPYYLISFEIGCLVFFVLIYLPFWLMSRERAGARKEPYCGQYEQARRMEI